MNKTKANRIKDYKGFTLIEILVATTIMAILLLALRETFTSATRLRRELMQRLNEWLIKERVQRVIEEDFKGIVFTYSIMAPSLQLSRQRLGATYQSSKIIFYTNNGRTSSSSKWPEIQKVYYYLLDSRELERYGFFITNQTGAILVRGLIRNLLAQVQPEPTIEPLCPDVENFTVELFDGSTWLSELSLDLANQSEGNTNNFPCLARIRIEFVNDPKAQWVRSPIELLCPIYTQPIQRQTSQVQGSVGNSSGSSSISGGQPQTGLPGQGGSPPQQQPTPRVSR